MAEYGDDNADAIVFVLGSGKANGPGQVVELYSLQRIQLQRVCIALRRKALVFKYTQHLLAREDSKNLKQEWDGSKVPSSCHFAYQTYWLHLTSARRFRDHGPGVGT